MARILPVDDTSLQPLVKEAFEKHVQEYHGRITNMKASLGHSLLAFEVYMQWYPLYKAVELITGNRLAWLYAYAISYSSDCPLCSTFFRKIIIDAGEKPENLVVTETEQKLIDFGSSIAKNKGHITDEIYTAVADYYTTEELVVLIAFAGQMIATNIFNNVIETNIDDYLTPYLPPTN